MNLASGIGAQIGPGIVIDTPIVAGIVIVARVIATPRR
jgi:hypothetical protein